MRQDAAATGLARRWESAHSNFRFVPVISDAEPSDEWTGRAGFVHTAVIEDHPDLSGHQVYACDCSRKDLAEAGGDPPARETPYTGRCRDRGLVPGPGRGLRVALPAGEETFDDLALGRQRQHPSAQCGDLLLRDRLGNWTYQFAVVVDDQAQDIDLVIRGVDLLESTGRQLLLARMLGRETPPRFVHHPLIRRPGGEKLSKANRDTATRDLRSAGVTPETLFGRIISLLSATPEVVLARDAAANAAWSLLTTLRPPED